MLIIYDRCKRNPHVKSHTFDLKPQIAHTQLNRIHLLDQSRAKPRKAPTELKKPAAFIGAEEAGVSV